MKIPLVNLHIVKDSTFNRKINAAETKGKTAAFKSDTRIIFSLGKQIQRLKQEQTRKCLRCRRKVKS